MKFIWDNGTCETTIYDWKEVTSNCYSGSYNIETVVQDDGLKYFKWGPILRDGKPSYIEGITYFDDGSFAVLYKEESPDANWSVSSPKLEISDISYNDSYKVKKNIYDFQISLLDTLIYLEKNSETSSNKEIEKFIYCKNNLPADLFTNIEDYRKVNFNKINKDLEIFSKISQTDEGGKSFDKWLETAMSGSEEPNTLPEGFGEISSVDNFLAIFGGMFAYGFGCEMFE